MKERLLRNGIGKIIVLVVIIALIVSLRGFYNISAYSSENSAKNEAARISDVISTFRTLYTSEVIAKLEDKGIEITHDYKDKVNAIPLPATLSMHIGESLMEGKEKHSVTLYSPYPFPHRTAKAGLNDDFKKEAWDYLQKNPTKNFTRFEIIDGEKFLRYASADVMRISCVNCHNTHPNTPKVGWKVGDVRGVLEVRKIVPTLSSNMDAEFYASTVYIIIPFLIILVVLIYLVWRFKNISNKFKEQKREIEESRKALGESISELNKIGYAFSHDLKTPIHGINSLATHIKNDLGDSITEDISSSFDLIQKRTLRMSKMIEGYGKYIQNVQTKVVLSEFFVDEFFDHILFNLLGNSSNKITYPQDRKIIKTDRIKLSILFHEILDNSIAHNSQDIKKIDITFEDSETHLLFTVTDNGDTIDPKYFEKVFEPLQTLELKDKNHGVGMGLAIASKIIKQLNGSITFKTLEDNRFMTTIKIKKVR